MARDDFLKDVSKELIVQEAMYGFVMALTFVTAVQLGIVEYHDRGRLCLAISGMIFVWGMIDMFIFFRMDMMSLKRTAISYKRAMTDRDSESSRGIIADELDGTIVDLVDGETRERIVDAILMSETSSCDEGIRAERRVHVINAIAAAIVTFATALPVIACIMLISDFGVALIMSSVTSSIALFFVGYSMSPYSNGIKKIGTGIAVTLASLALTLFAALLGG